MSLKAQVFNQYNQRIEQLIANGTILQITDDGGNVLVTGQTITLLLELNRTYLINKIKITYQRFENPDLSVYAFPRFEQFDTTLLMMANTYDGTNLVKQLFTGMQFSSSDGITFCNWFEQPFLFRTDTSTETQLILNFVGSSGIFVNLTGMVVPPAAEQEINLIGEVSFEGVSWGIDETTAKKFIIEDADENYSIPEGGLLD